MHNCWFFIAQIDRVIELNIGSMWIIDKSSSLGLMWYAQSCGQRSSESSELFNEICHICHESLSMAARGLSLSRVEPKIVTVAEKCLRSSEAKSTLPAEKLLAIRRPSSRSLACSDQCSGSCCLGFQGSPSSLHVGVRDSNPRVHDAGKMSGFQGGPRPLP